MPRDSSGNYSLPGGINPVITGTTITSTWANTTMNDIASALTDSLSRSGKGGMNAAILLQDGTSGAPGLAFASEQTTGLYRNGASQPTFVVTGVPVWSANSSKQFLIYAIDNQAAEIYNDGTPTSGFWNEWQNAGVARGRIGTGPALMTGAALGDFGITAVSGVLRIGTIAVTTIQIDQSQQVTIGPPAATANEAVVIKAFGTDALAISSIAVGVGLGIMGQPGKWTQIISGSATAGGSFGLFVRAGSTTADQSFLFDTQAGSVMLQGWGDGEVLVATPPSNAKQATGSPPAGPFQVGYLDSPLDTQNANYTIPVTDRGCTVGRTGGVGPFTWTLPASTVAFAGMMFNCLQIPAVTGDTIIAPGAGVTLYWIETGGTGSRHLVSGAAGAIATIYYVTNAIAYIWGTNIS
jgi:hypothetical protein